MIDELFPNSESESGGSVHEHDIPEFEMPVAMGLPPVPAFFPDAPPAPHMEEASQASSTRGVATCTVRYPPYGTISFYLKGFRFQATCSEGYADHVRCILTRYSTPSATMHAKGRRLGMMMAWLRHSHETTSRHEHISVYYVHTLTFERRNEGRAFLQTLANGPEMCTYERTRRAGEGDEPEGMP
jgi:hypothetical protein